MASPSTQQEITEQCTEAFPYMYHFSYLDIVAAQFPSQWKKWSPPTGGSKVSAFLVPIPRNAQKLKDMADYSITKVDTIMVTQDRAGHKGMTYAVPICEIKVPYEEKAYYCPVLPVGVIENIADLVTSGVITQDRVPKMTGDFAANLNKIIASTGLSGEAFLFDDSEDLTQELAKLCDKYEESQFSAAAKTSVAYTCEDVGKAVALAHFIALETCVLQQNESNVNELMAKWLESYGGGRVFPKLLQLVIKEKDVKGDLQAYNRDCIKQTDIFYPMVRRAWQDLKRYQMPVFEITNPDNAEEKVFVMINATPGLYVLNSMLVAGVLTEDNYRRSQQSCIAELKHLIDNYTNVGETEPLCKDKVLLLEFSPDLPNANLASALYKAVSADGIREPTGDGSCQLV